MRGKAFSCKIGGGLKGARRYFFGLVVSGGWLFLILFFSSFFSFAAEVLFLGVKL